jgi:hypothetical protein
MTDNREALVRKVAQAITDELMRQEGMIDGLGPLPESLELAFIDQNCVDMGAVARAAIEASAPAIRAAALEEAAKVAEQKFRIDQIRRDRMLDEEWEQDRETAGDEIAAAISALIPAPPEAT